MKEMKWAELSWAGVAVSALAAQAFLCEGKADGWGRGRLSPGHGQHQRQKLCLLWLLLAAVLPACCPKTWQLHPASGDAVSHSLYCLWSQTPDKRWSLTWHWEYFCIRTAEVRGKQKVVSRGEGVVWSWGRGQWCRVTPKPIKMVVLLGSYLLVHLGQDPNGHCQPCLFAVVLG